MQVDMLSVKSGEPERRRLPGAQHKPRYVITRARRFNRGVCEVIDAECHGCGQELNSKAAMAVCEGYSPLGALGARRGRGLGTRGLNDESVVRNGYQKLSCSDPLRRPQTTRRKLVTVAANV